mgnify:CR=1 FL=1
MFGGKGFPFADMPGAPPGSGQSKQGGRSKKVDNTRYYELLGVSKTATDS